MSQTIDTMGKLTDVTRRVTVEFDADILLYSGGIYAPADESVLRQVCSNKSKDSVVLMLTTLGGSPDVAYRIARCIRQKYSGKFTVFVDTICKSAGTLIALGADALIMSDRAHLGPLDIQLANREEVGELSSGLTPSQALETLTAEAGKLFESQFRKLRYRAGTRFSTRMAAQTAARMTIGLLRPIYEQIDPMRLGENERAMKIAAEYGGRLASKNAKEGTLAKLVMSYPSHSFVIDRQEAAELFNLVSGPSVDLATLSLLLTGLVDEGQDNDDKGAAAVVNMISILVAPPPPADTMPGGGAHEQTARTTGTGAAQGGAANGPTAGDGKQIAPEATGPSGAAASNGV